MKLGLVEKMSIEVEVAPFTGAWIETLIARKTLMIIRVAPFTGAWIETF